MGEVYQAYQVHLKRDVAIKVISWEWLESINDDEYERQTGLQRFRNEVQAMARVRHPNVLQIYDYGTLNVQKDGRDLTLEYIAMEYVPGGTLRSTMSEDGLDDDEDAAKEWLKRYFFPVLDGVQAIHELKMVHRDLKPGNVLMDGELPKIADFGLAHSYEWQPVTQSIDVKGTPAYMSPEHFFEFAKADHRSDIYSLGKMLFEAINGRMSSRIKPFKQVSLKNPETAFFRDLDKIIRIATAENKEERFSSIKEFRSAIENALEAPQQPLTGNDIETLRSHSVWNRPLFIWTGIALAVLSMVAMGIWHLMGVPVKTTGPSAPISPVISPGETKTEGITESSGEPTPFYPKESILGQDGIRMRLIQGTESKYESGLAPGEPTESLTPFYLDEQPVSNYHFVEFLNEVKDTLTVEDGVVKQSGKIWYYLGQGTEPYEQIIFQHGRFHLRDTAFAGRPVVRVTWYGAQAYARHYGKRLPTESEWRYAANLVGRKIPSVVDQPSIHTQHMAMQPVGNAEPQTSLSGTDVTDAQLQQTVREWAVRTASPRGDGNQVGLNNDGKYSGIIVGPPHGTDSTRTGFRYPWEGFRDVGFRCALDVGQ